MTAAPPNGLENEAKQVGINWNVAPLQAFCAGMAGYAATPLIQCSNKSSLPGLSVREVIAMTKIDPFLGARWTSFRQFVSSIRGTVPVSMLAEASRRNGGTVTLLDYVCAVLAGGTVETCIAGVFIEIPETRVQSGLSRFSLGAVKCFPFLLGRNIGTTIAPLYVVQQEMNRKGTGAATAGDDLGSDSDGELQKWSSALGRTLAMSTIVAVMASPLQGVAARVIQEQTLADAVRNTRADFRWENRHITLLRVGTRALFIGITGTAITVAYLAGDRIFG